MRRQLIATGSALAFSLIPAGHGAAADQGHCRLDDSPAASPREKIGRGELFKLRSPTLEQREARRAMLQGVELPSIRYRIEDVGTFGGPLTASNATGMNELGHVVGLAEDDNLAYGNHGFLYRDGELLDIGYLFDTSNYTYAKGVNDVDQVVGQTKMLIPGAGGPTTSGPFVWSEATGMTGIVPPEHEDFPFGWCWGINNAGRLALMAGFRPYVWDPVTGFTQIELPNLPDTAGEAWEINNAGIVAGQLDDALNREHAFRYDSNTGVLVDLHDAATYEESEAYGLNDNGDLVGWGLRYDSTYARAMVWPAEGGAMELPIGDIDPIYNAWSNAEHINNHGDVVGEDASSVVLPVGWVLFDALGGGPQQKIPLELLLSEADQAEWEIVYAFEINDARQVVGIGLRDLGEPDLVTRGFLMTPICSADITGPGGAPDGNVDALDLLAVLAQWGSPCTGPCTADITGPLGCTGDGNVDVLDLLLVIASWGGQ